MRSLPWRSFLRPNTIISIDLHFKYHNIPGRYCLVPFKQCTIGMLAVKIPDSSCIRWIKGISSDITHNLRDSYWSTGARGSTLGWRLKDLGNKRPYMVVPTSFSYLSVLSSNLYEILVYQMSSFITSSPHDIQPKKLHTMYSGLCYLANCSQHLGIPSLLVVHYCTL